MHRDPLHAVLGNTRVKKAAPQHHHHNLHHHAPHHNLSPKMATHFLGNSSDHNTYRSCEGSKAPYPTMHQRSHHGIPPRNNRLPSLFDRIKAALEAPPRPHLTIHTLPFQTRPYPAQPAHPSTASSHSLPQPSTTISTPTVPAIAPLPTLFGVECSEVSQRAYSGQNSEMKGCFGKLEKLDKGIVEHRTIAFSTHLTVSRWEPVTPSSSSASASSTSQKDPAMATRLMSLANYIRHIISLTSGIPAIQSQAAFLQRQQQQQAQTTATALSSHTASTSTDSSGPGPSKSESRRRHRYSPDYHNHAARRAFHHQQQSRHETPAPCPPALSFHDHQNSDSAPQAPPSQHPRENAPHPNLDPLQPLPSSNESQPPLLKIPFPNLTLTLALIYVDRLKAKYPEAKGEPGCSQRLFLVAFIIAAKYRCCVELSAPPPQLVQVSKKDQSPRSEGNKNDSQVPVQDNSMALQGPLGQLPLTEERGLNAQLVLSNHAWIRLLNLGSFFRAPTVAPSTANSSAASSALPLPIQSSSSSSSLQTQTQAPPPLPSPSPDTPSLPSAGILQVEDLDRMEAEFLTFLNCDLATMSHDLETCWNLLVGPKTTP